MEPNTSKLIKSGFPAEKVEGFVQIVFQGTNSRVYNAPIDLFIEDYIFERFPELKPQQFLSLTGLGKTALQAVTDPEVLAITPSLLVSKIKVYNALSARQFDDLFGTETEKEYPLNPTEKNQVNAFWEEYNEYRNDKEPGEEYELLQNWAEDLELDVYFKLQAEQHGGQKSPEAFSDSIEQDLYQGNGLSKEDEKEMKRFIEDSASKNFDTGIVADMLDALRYFKNKSGEKIEEVAFETSTLAKAGIKTEQQNLKLNSIPSKTFSGSRFMSYYYVAWCLIKPEFIHELGLPYEKEFEVARKIFLKEPS